MKKQIVSLLATFVVLAASVVATRAQSANRPTFVVNIPFEFSIGRQKTLPAGEYIVERMQSQVRLISKRDGRAYLTTLTIQIQTQATQDRSHLVFNRYGDQYFLAQVWNSATNVGMELHKSHQESASELATNRTERETVTLIARR